MSDVQEKACLLVKSKAVPPNSTTCKVSNWFVDVPNVCITQFS
jgi:hypothetical protein